MKLFLNDKTPVLTEEDMPTWHCPATCCFNDLHYGALSCQYFRKQCSEGYSYTSQDSIYDIFKL